MVWPIWSVADMDSMWLIWFLAVADIVLLWPISLWPIWFMADTLAPQIPDVSLTVRGTPPRHWHVKCYLYHAHTSTKYLYGRKYAAYNKQF